MMIISGSELSKETKAALKASVEALQARGKRKPCLSVILMGDNPASQSYVKSKEKACLAVGMEPRTIRLPETTSQEALEALVEEENRNPDVDGILVQLPLPAGLDERAVLARISPDKDVDGLHVVNAGRLSAGQKGFVPCTPKGIMALLKKAGYEDLSGLRAVVVGRSQLVGQPVAKLLQDQNATVTIIHSRTREPEKIAREADILVAAIGRPEYIGADWIKPGAAVIDVGINRVEGKLKGDVDFEAVKDIAGAITPVPGGVGPMTVAMLLDNTLQAWALHEGEEEV